MDGLTQDFFEKQLKLLINLFQVISAVPR